MDRWLKGPDHDGELGIPSLGKSRKRFLGAIADNEVKDTNDAKKQRLQPGNEINRNQIATLHPSQSSNFSFCGDVYSLIETDMLQGQSTPNASYMKSSQQSHNNRFEKIKQAVILGKVFVVTPTTERENKQPNTPKTASNMHINSAAMMKQPSGLTKEQKARVEMNRMQALERLKSKQPKMEKRT